MMEQLAKLLRAYDPTHNPEGMTEGERLLASMSAAIAGGMVADLPFTHPDGPVTGHGFTQNEAVARRAVDIATCIVLEIGGIKKK